MDLVGGEVRGKRLAIYVNENRVAPWDPFCRSEENTKRLEPRVLRYEGGKGKGDIVVEPYVLPHQSRFSSPEAFSRASGPEKWNKQQGLYIYRADRMIQSGGWSGLRASDEHLKLARIAISFAPKFDDEFKINVAKMRVSLPAGLRDEVGRAVASAVTTAQDEYRKRERKADPVTTTVAPPAPGSSPLVAPAAPERGTVEPMPPRTALPAAPTVGRPTIPTVPSPSVGTEFISPGDLRHFGVVLRGYVKEPGEELVLERLLTRAAEALFESC